MNVEIAYNRRRNENTGNFSICANMISNLRLYDDDAIIIFSNKDESMPVGWLYLKECRRIFKYGYKQIVRQNGRYANSFVLVSDKVLHDMSYFDYEKVNLLPEDKN